MRKRFVTTVLTFLLTLACVFCFAACEEKETGLTGEELKAAIQATLNSKKAEFNFKVVQGSTEEFNVTEIFDEEKGIIAIKHDLVYDEFYVLDSGEVWNCDLQDGEWYVRKISSSFDEVNEEYKSEVLMYCFQFKDKTNTSAEYVSFEDIYSSFKFDSNSGLYSASLLCYDNLFGNSDEEVEANVTLTVVDGFVTDFVFELKPQNLDEVYTYSYIYENIGTAVITVPSDILTKISESKQN